MPSTLAQPVTSEQLHELTARVEAAAGQDMPFLTLLIELQVKLIGGLSGAVFTILADADPRLVTVYPMARNQHVRVEPDRIDILRDCVERCRKARRLSVYRVGMGGQVYHTVCTPLMLDGQVDGVTVVMTATEDRSQLAPHLAHVEWAGRLYSGHVAARRLRRQKLRNAEARKALSTLAAAHQAEHFHECCMSVCNQLSIELNTQRICLGWVYGHNVRLVAMSDTENVDRRQELSRQIEAAMEECTDQGQAVVAPIDGVEQGEDVLAHVVSRCHHELLGGDGESVCSVPLRFRDDVWGVLTVERTAKSKFDGQIVSHIQAIGDLITPRLVDRFTDDRSAPVKLLHGVRAMAGCLVGAENVGGKLVVMVLFAAVLYAGLARWDYRIEAPFEFEFTAKQVYAAPFSGHIENVWVRRGDAVKEGDRLLQLDDRHLRLLREASQQRLAVAEIDHRKALAESAADVPRFRAQMRQYEAERALYDMQVQEATLTARHDGVVVLGEWHESLGVRVELGQKLFEVAPTSSDGGTRNRLRAVIRVDESEVDRVEIGSAGQLAARSDPTVLTTFRVSRVVPIGEPHEGRNVFAVYGDLDPKPWMQSGMQGVAKIDAGRERVIWILTHKLVDFLRLAVW